MFLTLVRGAFLLAPIVWLPTGAAAAEMLQTAVPANAPNSGAEGSQAVADGWAAFRCGDLAAADEHFREAARHGEAEGWLGQAEVARRKNLPADAVFAFREYLSREPEDDRRRLEFALMLSWEGLHAEAEFEFRRLVRISPEASIRSAARRGLADTLAWSGRHRDAHDLYREELAVSPGDPDLTRALAELESWHGRHGSAELLYSQSLTGREDARTRELAHRSDESLRPQAFTRVQAFADDADWRRLKILSGGEGRLFPDTRPDAWSAVAVEHASFEEASGRKLARRSLILRHRERPSTFTNLDFDLAYGDVRGATSWRGGVLAETQWKDRVWAWASIRRDDWADPIASHPFDRYNGAFTVDLLRTDILQATTLRGGLLAENAQGLGVLVELQGGPIEDGNGHQQAYLQVHRSREYAPDRRSIPRVFYHHIGFSESSTLYYSPENVDSWGLGWRWEAKEADWNAYADASLFWQAGTVSDYGIQAGVGVERSFDAGFLLRLEANFLSTDDRGLDDRYEAYAVAASIVVPF